MSPLRVYIGWDPAEATAYHVAEKSLRAHSSVPVLVTPIRVSTLADFGLLRRPTDRRDASIYDLPSNAPCSTEFAISRFLVPHLAQTGAALFVDSDVVFMDDVAKLFALQDESKAVQVVKHQHEGDELFKMDGAPQTCYPRKNWSSVILWNCDHPGNRRLSLQDVNERPGRDLHAFYWLADSEIGELPKEWNWLVDVQPMPEQPKIAHFTLGGPFTRGWDVGSHEHDKLWLEAAK